MRIKVITKGTWKIQWTKSLTTIKYKGLYCQSNAETSLENPWRGTITERRRRKEETEEGGYHSIND